MFSRLYHVYTLYVLGVDYQLSDSTTVNLIKRVSTLIEPDSSSADIYELTRAVIEHEADVQNNAVWFVDALLERAIFESAKKTIAGK